MELQLTDFRLAGFLLVKEIKFLRTDVNANGEVVFVFDNKEGKALSMLNFYPNSPEQKYDSACKTMHDFVKTLSRIRGREKRKY